MLAPVLGPLHRVPEAYGGPRHEHLLRPGVHDLHAEPAAHVGGDHLDPVHREAELGRHRLPHAGGGLRGGVHEQGLVVGVPAGQDTLALHRHGGAALDGQVELEDVGGGVDRRLGVAGLLHHHRRRVAGDVGVHEVGGGARGVDPDHGRQRLVVDPDPADDVLGDVPVDGHHHHDGLADVVDLVARQGVLGPAVGQRGVRDQQRQRLAHPAVEVLVGVDRHQAVHLDPVGDVDVEDPGVGVRAADERHLVRVVAEVVEVAAVPGDQPRVLAPPDPGAEQLGGHAPSPRLISAARCTAATMFW